MTLDELRQQLQKLGIKQVGAMRRSSAEEPVSVSIVFSADAKIVFPFGMKTAYFLALDSSDPSTPVHSEKYKALMRAIERDRKNGTLPSSPPKIKPKKSN